MNDTLLTWHFGIDNDKLVDLVLEGKKIATTSYLDEPSKIGEESVLIYDSGKKACVTKTIKVIEIKFKDINWELAKLEGENVNLEEWQDIHRKYFKSIDKNFNDDSIVTFEIFEAIEKKTKSG